MSASCEVFSWNQNLGISRVISLIPEGSQRLWAVEEFEARRRLLASDMDLPNDQIRYGAILLQQPGNRHPIRGSGALTHDIEAHNKEHPMAQATLKNQRTIIANDRVILRNQRKILGNQRRLKLLLGNQFKILRNQKAIIKNQKKILAAHARLITKYSAGAPRR